MRTYRKEPRREQIRRKRLQRQEALGEASAQFAARFYDLASGRTSARGLGPPTALTYRRILARRAARIVSGATLLASSAVLALLLWVAPALLPLALICAWIAGIAAYIAAHIRVMTRETASPEPDAEPTSIERRAHRLETLSLALPCVGLIPTVILPIGWLVYSVGLSELVTYFAMLILSYACYSRLSSAVEGEREELGDRPNLPAGPST